MTAGLSIVVPLYNEAKGLAQLHARLVEAARNLSARRGLAVEVVYVDDGSRDDTLAVAHRFGATGMVTVLAIAMAVIGLGGGTALFAARRRVT